MGAHGTACRKDEKGRGGLCDASLRSENEPRGHTLRAATRPNRHKRGEFATHSTKTRTHKQGNSNGSTSRHTSAVWETGMGLMARSTSRTAAEGDDMGHTRSRVGLSETNENRRDMHNGSLTGRWRCTSVSTRGAGQEAQATNEKIFKQRDEKFSRRQSSPFSSAFISGHPVPPRRHMNRHKYVHFFWHK